MPTNQRTTRTTGITIATTALTASGWHVQEVTFGRARHLLVTRDDQRRLVLLITTSKDDGWLLTRGEPGKRADNLKQHAAQLGAEEWIGGVDINTGDARWGAAGPVLAALQQDGAIYDAGLHHSINGMAKGLQVVDLPDAM